MPELMQTASSNPFTAMIPEEYRTTTPLSPHEFAVRQCEWYNSSEGKLEGYQCGECKNRGYFQRLDADDNPVMRECKCMATRRYIRMMRSSGLGDIYENCTFDRYIVSSDWQRRCKESAERFAGQDGSGWFFFAGNSGSGKTHLCTAICSELAKRGRSVKYVQWKRLFAQLIQTKFKYQEQEQIMQEMTNADVLYLDDFLKTPRNIEPQEEMLSFALDIIDARYKSDRKTIISTEFMMDEIISFDEALGGRIREKTMGNKCMVKREQGRNYRMKG